MASHYTAYIIAQSYQTFVAARHRAEYIHLRVFSIFVEALFQRSATHYQPGRRCQQLTSLFDESSS